MKVASDEGQHYIAKCIDALIEGINEHRSAVPKLDGYRNAFVKALRKYKEKHQEEGDYSADEFVLMLSRAAAIAYIRGLPETKGQVQDEGLNYVVRNIREMLPMITDEDLHLKDIPIYQMTSLIDKLNKFSREHPTHRASHRVKQGLEDLNIAMQLYGNNKLKDEDLWDVMSASLKRVYPNRLRISLKGLNSIVRAHMRNVERQPDAHAVVPSKLPDSPAMFGRKRIVNQHITREMQQLLNDVGSLYDAVEWTVNVPESAMESFTNLYKKASNSYLLKTS